MVPTMHRTITYAIRTMLHAAGLPYAFWPYVLQHFVAISNSLPQGDRAMSPVKMCSGRKNDLSLARIFGCRCYALPTSRRPAKLDVHARIGVFLGYDSSWKHPRYFDLTTRVVQSAKQNVL